MTTTSVDLFLAREMGLDLIWYRSEGYSGKYVSVEDHAPPDNARLLIAKGPRFGLPSWSPHTDRAQFAEVLLWAVRKEIPISIYPVSVWCDGLEIPHDNTDESIVAATLLAIAKARGYEDE